MTKEPKKSKGNVLKIIELGLETRVFEQMKLPGFSAEALAREFKSEGIDISAQSIRKFIRKSRKAQQELIQTDLRTAEVYKQTVMDYSKAIRDILDEVEEVKNEAKTEKDMATYNQLVGRLMQGLELMAKLTGDIKPKGSVDIKIIYNEINNDVEKEMKKIEGELFRGKTIDIDKVVKKETEEEAKKLL